MHVGLKDIVGVDQSSRCNILFLATLLLQHIVNCLGQLLSRRLDRRSLIHFTFKLGLPRISQVVGALISLRDLLICFVRGISFNFLLK